MRIISGSSGGIPLQVPKNVTRPTTERTRGAIFNKLGDRIPGAYVLDLFAGSGAYGIESLSRGAAQATFVEADKAAAAIIRANLTKARLANGHILPIKVEMAWDKLPEASADIIFADPPYKKQKDDPDHLLSMLTEPALAKVLRPGGLLVTERFSKSPLPTLPSYLEVVDEKIYGDCAVAFLGLKS